MARLSMQPLRAITRLVVDHQLLISLAAVSLGFCSSLLLHFTLSPLFYAFLFGTTLAAYLFPFLQRSSLRKTERGILLAVLGVDALFLTVTLFGAFYFRFAIAYLLLALLTLAYYLPLAGPGTQLRQIPFLKPFLIAFNWTVATVLLPVLAAGRSPWHTDALLLFAERWVFMVGITLPFDIRDLEADRRVGLCTIPQALGIRRTLWLAQGFLLVYLAMTWWHEGWGPLLWARLACVALLWLLLAPLDGRQSRLYYTGLLDGTMILQALLVYWTL